MIFYLKHQLNKTMKRDLNILEGPAIEELDLLLLDYSRRHCCKERRATEREQKKEREREREAYAQQFSKT
jgi:hypothetical protein